METTANGWVVIDRAARVLTSAYVFDGKTSTANAFVAPLADGKLMVISPPFRASEGLFRDLEGFGEIGAVVANNGFHHLGQPEWKARYPSARFFAPTDAFARIRKHNPKAPNYEPLAALKPLLGPEVGVTEASSTKCGESWAWAKIDGGFAWFVSDMLANMEGLPGNFVLRQLFKWSGSAPGFKPFNLGMKFILKDKRAVLRALSRDMVAHPPTVIIPSHGTVLTRDGLASETQRLLAEAIE
jgi:hypothetical protein